MGAVLAQTGRVQEGIAELRTAIRIDPRYASAHDILGQILCGVGYDREGRAELEEAARLKAAGGQTGP
jgi:Flp pilus assembly protein TadD